MSCRFWTGNWHPYGESRSKVNIGSVGFTGHCSVPIPAACHILQLDASCSSWMQSCLQLQEFRAASCC